ncbi:MAG TPA: Gfo/Idh/MocA family oxidoreductase, partial [Tessaracoccus flavescens]|nr:Gfo/Idh/MocA family oxidoreductase [Tessaracoccus flavescens]
MINVAIFGAGNISGAHVDAYRQFPERCRITAICDIVPGKAERRAEDWGLTDVDTVGHVDELLKLDDVDLVSICTPPSTHADLAVAVLKAGKHVILEKPMASSVAECQRIEAAAAESGAVLSVVAQNRFRNDMALLKEALDSGLIGPVTHARVDSAWWRGLP